MFGLKNKLKTDAIITSLACQNDLLLGVTDDRRVLAFDMKDTFQMTRTVRATHITSPDFTNSKFTHISVSLNGLAAIACSDKSILLLDVEAGIWIDRLFGHIGLIDSLYFTPESDFLIAVGEEDAICVWNLGHGRDRKALLTRSQSETLLDFEVKDEFMPSWIRKPSKSCTPSNPILVPKGRWATVKCPCMERFEQN